MGAVKNEQAPPVATIATASGIFEVNRGARSRGVANIEAALLIPILIFIAAALLSLGIRLANYMYLNQIGRELVLKMASTRCLANFSQSGLPTEYTYVVGPTDYDPAPPTESWIISCLTDIAGACPNTGTRCPVDLVDYYASLLVRSRRLILDGNVTMRYSFVAPPADPTSGICLIRVEFDAKDVSWLGFLGGPIHTVSEAPYTSMPVPTAASACQCPVGGC